MSGETVIRFDGVAISVAGQTIVRMPADASALLPSRGQVAVTGRFNDRPFDTVIEPDGLRGHWLRLDDDLERLLSDERVHVELQPTKVWPEPDVPGDLRDALDEASDLADTWTSITPMARWEWVRWVSATRNPQTRQRRVEVSISKLRKGMRRPCCFDLAACTDPDLSRSGKLVDSL